jgi:hypothetical protein
MRLRVVAISPSRVVLTWTDRSTTETGFSIERWRAGRGWQRIVTTAANATTFTDTTTVAATRYAYRVRAVGGALQSPVLSAATAVVWTRTPLRGRR